MEFDDALLTTNRRRFLQTALTAGLSATAGCSFLERGDGSSTETPDRAVGKRNWRQFHVGSTNAGFRSDGYGPTGTVSDVWTSETGGKIAAAPAVAEGVVYATSMDGYLYAFDEKNGERKWRRRLVTGTASGGRSSPAIVGDSVYVGSQDRTVRSLEASSGTVEWTFDTEYRVVASPTVSDDTVYVGDIDGDTNVYAIDATTGEERWRFPVGFGVRSAVAVADDTVFVAALDGHLYAVDADTGEERWRFTSSKRQGFGSAPAIADGRVYVGGSDSHVYAIDAATGRAEWQFETGQWTYPTPAVTEEAVCAMSFDGNLYSLNRNNGRERWRFETNGYTPRSDPVVVGDTVYFGAFRAGTVYGLNLSNGDIRWSYRTQSAAIWCSPAVVNGTVYVGDYDGTMYALADE